MLEEIYIAGFGGQGALSTGHRTRSPPVAKASCACHGVRVAV